MVESSGKEWLGGGFLKHQTVFFIVCFCFLFFFLKKGGQVVHLKVFFLVWIVFFFFFFWVCFLGDSDCCFFLALRQGVLC